MIEPPEVPHQHHHEHGAQRHPLLRWFFDAVMPISVLLMSIGSLYVALHTGNAMDKLVAHNEKLVKAQSTPIIQYSTGNYDEGSQRAALSFTIANVGTGPARLHWLRVSDGDKVFETVKEWLQSLAEDEERESLRGTDLLSSDVDGTVIPARDQLRPLFWAKPGEAEAPAQAVWERANKARFRLKIEFCYCSVFDDCWQQKADQGPARSLPRCEAPKAATPVLAAASGASQSR